MCIVLETVVFVVWKLRGDQIANHVTYGLYLLPSPAKLRTVGVLNFPPGRAAWDSAPPVGWRAVTGSQWATVPPPAVPAPAIVTPLRPGSGRPSVQLRAPPRWEVRLIQLLWTAVTAHVIRSVSLQ